MRQHHSHHAANRADGDRFAHDQPQHQPRGKAQSLKHSNFGAALTHSHAHGVSRDQKDGKHDSHPDSIKQKRQFPAQGYETGAEQRLGFGVGLGFAVFKSPVDGFADAGGLAGVCDLHAIGAHQALLSNGLVEVLVVKQHHVVAGAGEANVIGFVNPPYHEFKGLLNAIKRALELQRVAHA